MRNESRSMNADLHEGSVDGKYKRIRPNVGGTVEPMTARNRTDLDTQKYDVREAPQKVTPDGTLV